MPLHEKLLVLEKEMLECELKELEKLQEGEDALLEEALEEEEQGDLLEDRQEEDDAVKLLLLPFLKSSFTSILLD